VTNPAPTPENPDPAHLAHVQENFVRHMLPLRGFVLSLIPRRHLADDVVQETFLTVCARAGSYRRDTNYRAWLFTIARFKVLAALKREAGTGELIESESAELLMDETRPAGMPEVPERLAALDRCVDRLARMARRAVDLRYRDGLGPTEVAERLGWQVNALNVALSRARAFLRRCVEEALRTGRTCGP
jgi:RNA polymerase sigma-70 factor, ECF subfamily